MQTSRTQSGRNVVEAPLSSPAAVVLGLWFSYGRPYAINQRGDRGNCWHMLLDVDTGEPLDYKTQAKLFNMAQDLCASWSTANRDATMLHGRHGFASAAYVTLTDVVSEAATEQLKEAATYMGNSIKVRSVNDAWGRGQPRPTTCANTYLSVSAADLASALRG